jgi:hypothetical protein
LTPGEGYVEIRVPAADLHGNLAKFEKTLAYRRLSWRDDNAWGLVWDFRVAEELAACERERDVLTACLRRATALLAPGDAELVRSYYRELLEA